jgi:hypothetical protein
MLPLVGIERIAPATREIDSLSVNGRKSGGYGGE